MKGWALITLINQTTTTIIMKIFVEGIVGCGKTTIIRFAQEQLPWLKPKEEPVDEWIGEDGENCLYSFFEDDSLFLTLQHTILRVGVPLAVGQEFNMIDRGCSTCMVYSTMYRDQNKLTEEEFRGVATAVEAADLELTANHPDWFRIYLKCDPRVAHARKEGRGTNSGPDQDVSWETALQRAHEDWFAVNHPDRTLVLDVSNLSKVEAGEAFVKLILAQTQSL